ncbi:MAG: hypothetical protein LBK95_15685 [Bifidobacteriaceae bacterium]|nr:hypothetical protein [Bifidobacteriaceae bacterium]
MSAHDRRAQILFAPEQYEALETLASSQRRSVGSLVREAVDNLVARQRHDRRAAFKAFLTSISLDGQTGMTLEQWREDKTLTDPIFVDK